MKTQRILSAIIGITQAVIGLFSGVSAILLGLHVIEIQQVLISPPEFLVIYILIIGLFSLFSVISALFLIREWRG
jgi:ABC-type microcin C transport system permease subunit YejE